MSGASEVKGRLLSLRSGDIPVPVLEVFRGIAQVFFQENALTGACFALGIAGSSMLMAIAAVAGSAIGTAVARLLKFDGGEISAGIYGFNATLVGIATFVFFQLSAGSVLLLVGGCIAATLVTWIARRHVPFPTYTAPFVVTTWGLYFLGMSLGLAPAGSGGIPASQGFIAAVAHGVGQVMFQASLWTGLLFLIGIALNDREHAAWVLFASIAGALVAGCSAIAAARGIAPETLVDNVLADKIGFGLYGYNATLAAVALFLWRRSLIPPLLGILLTIPITEFFPVLGLPALTAPFVLATWLVLACGRLEAKFFGKSTDSTI